MKIACRAAATGGVALLILAASVSASAAPSPALELGHLFPTTTAAHETGVPASPPVQAAVLAGGYDVPTFAYDVARTGKNPNEAFLGRSNVGVLGQAFAAGFANAGAMDAPPIGASNVSTASGARDLVYVGNEHGAFGAIDATTGAVVWERNVGFQHTTCGDFPNGDAGVTGSAVLDRPTNRVFVPGGDGKLHAFDMATGALVAGWPTPVFTTAPGKLHDYGALTLDTGNHRIYVTLASYCDHTPYKGSVVSFDSSTGGARRQFVVVKNTQSGGGIWGWGGASLDALHNVFVTTGNALPDGSTEATPYAEYLLKLSPAFTLLGAHHPVLKGLDVDFGATPTLIDVQGCAPMLAAENKNGHLYVYRRDNLKAGPLQNLTIVTTGPYLFVGLPAFDAATGTLFVTSPAGGPFGHGMLARRFGATCTSSPLWQTTAGPAASPVSSPTIGNGVVYYADGTGHALHAFDTSTGAELWHSAAGVVTGDVFSAPLLFDGRLFVSSRGGTMHAFAVSGH